MEVLDHERIIENEGIPFNYISNLMIEIQSILDRYEANLVFQV